MESLFNVWTAHKVSPICLRRETFEKRSSLNAVLFLSSINENSSKIHWKDMTFDQNYSLDAAANHSISFTDLVVQPFTAHATRESPCGVHPCRYWSCSHFYTGESTFVCKNTSEMSHSRGSRVQSWWLCRTDWNEKGNVAVPLVGHRRKWASSTFQSLWQMERHIHAFVPLWARCLFDCVLNPSVTIPHTTRPFIRDLWWKREKKQVKMQEKEWKERREERVPI